ncbi:MAG TPA: hypothetical protein VMN81_12465 [Vicinamibacterales bacterium]|nr:hypothetical protein [Vicinamibacterales bacterium]
MRGEAVTNLAAALMALTIFAAPAGAQVGMPDPSQMSGLPLPAPELPAGTLTVRVVRGAVTNNVANQKVEIAVGGARREGTTDASGRAEFTGLKPGDRVQASTSLDGARLESQMITMPAQGGVRVMLAAPAAGAEPGVVVFGGESRFIVERGDESLHVFYVLDIVNTARVPVAGGPLIFDLPSGAAGATLLGGSTAQATVGGNRVTVTGPFAPGTTALQIAYELPYRGARATIEQTLPAALPTLAAAGETTGGVTMESPQFAAMRDMDAGGRPFKVGNGPAIPAGGTLTLTFDNLPHHPRWPRFMALGVAVAIMIGGLVIGFAAKSAKHTVGRRALQDARAARFAELAALEEGRSSGAVSETHYAAERSRIVASLEDIYAALDVEQGA